MVVDTKNWQVPTEPGYKFWTPYIRTVRYENSAACWIDAYAHDKEARQDYRPSSNQRLAQGEKTSFDLFNNLNLKEGMQVQFRCDAVDGRGGSDKYNTDNYNVCIASQNPWKDGLYYHAIVKVSGAVYTISVTTEGPQVNDH